MRNLVIGYGEIGKGLADVIRESGMSLDIYDKEKGFSILPEYKPEELDILHICIPGTIPGFEDVVTEYIKLTNPILTVVHSTVQVGTTRKISLLAQTNNICHSPVRGRHPNLTLGILSYRKHFGLLNPKNRGMIDFFCNKCGIDFAIHPSPESTELGKLLELVRYGITLTLADFQDKLCKSHELTYNGTVDSFVESYNEGLDEIGDTHLKYPRLTPPGGEIGGHCVIENSYELMNNLDIDNEDLKSWLRRMIEREQGDRGYEV